MHVLENQVAQNAAMVKTPPGTLTGNLETNPKEYIQAITLRNGKEVAPKSQNTEIDRSLWTIDRSKQLIDRSTKTIDRSQDNTARKLPKNDGFSDEILIHRKFRMNCRQTHFVKNPSEIFDRFMTDLSVAVGNPSKIR